VGDLKRVAGKLLKFVQEGENAPGAEVQDARRAWWTRVRGWKEEHPLVPAMGDTVIMPQQVIAAIDRISGGNAIVASDVGQHQMWLAQFMRFNAPRLWLNSGGLGSMGFGVPAAIGAQVANPDKLVFAVVGDGGFQMSIPELSTAASNGLPVKIVVINNGCLGMVRQWQTLFYNNRLSGVTLDCFPDAEKLAAAYGFKGRTISKPSELAPALREAVDEPGLYLLNVRVDPDENVYPMVPAGAAINEMVLGPPQPVAVPE
jgi:acetolactate synthase-1/2/3 large subunit